jgi:hypothetical protein
VSTVALWSLRVRHSQRARPRFSGAGNFTHPCTSRPATGLLLRDAAPPGADAVRKVREGDFAWAWSREG